MMDLFLWFCFQCPRRSASQGTKYQLDSRHEALRKLLKLERQKAELTPQLAAKLGNVDQKTVSDIETRVKRVSELELIAIAQALGFDPAAAIRRIAKIAD
jgi:adenylate cyclase class IV